MRFVSFLKKQKDQIGIEVNGKIYDLFTAAESIDIELPARMKRFLKTWESNFALTKKVEETIKKGKVKEDFRIKDVKLLSPVPKPTSCRDGYAFRQHVATARRNRGVEMIPEFDQFPVFYFTNHNAVFGEGDVFVEADHLQKLDFELECAIVIGKNGINIEAKDADDYIAGYMIMNDLSARTLQMEEMKLNLGPAKGKDFATTFGPYLVTTDELEQFKIKTPNGNKFDLEMKAFHNGKQISSGNLKDMNWTFAEIIERASYGVELLPGDVIGSGTVGTGCYLELNGTRALEAKQRGEEFTQVWLQDGDTIELEIEALGKLKNRIVKKEKDYSILVRKKH
ncbi:MAG: fumarylacetoacetate hydrolase [Ignavibacteria bacterium RBG_16_34_14]|nr:MAG: fumarylacetoacetate hydrolase [Ignavibacteria bacterium RBG_16_34_14]